MDTVKHRERRSAAPERHAIEDVLLEYFEGAQRSRCGCSGVRMPAYSWSGVQRASVKDQMTDSDLSHKRIGNAEGPKSAIAAVGGVLP